LQGCILALTVGSACAPPRQPLVCGLQPGPCATCVPPAWRTTPTSHPRVCRATSCEVATAWRRAASGESATLETGRRGTPMSGPHRSHRHRRPGERAVRPPCLPIYVCAPCLGPTPLPTRHSLPDASAQTFLRGGLLGRCGQLELDLGLGGEIGGWAHGDVVTLQHDAAEFQVGEDGLR